MSTTQIPPIPPSVTLVDDDPALLNALTFSLEVDGFAVRCFDSAEALLEAGPIDHGCLVIDERLDSSIGGLDLVDILRRRGSRLPAILITTNPKPELVRRAASAGTPIVEKPLLGTALATAIRQALARATLDAAQGAAAPPRQP